MKTGSLAVAALAALGLSCAEEPRKPPSPRARAPRVALHGREIEVVLLLTEKDRRAAPGNLGAATETRGFLLAWPRERFMKLDSDRAGSSYDVAFLSLSGKVVDVQSLRRGDPEGIMPGVEAAYALLTAPGLLAQIGAKAGDAAELSAEVKDARPGELPIMKVGEVTAHVELALTEADRNRGLMFRPRMSAEDGMLFTYPDEGFRRYWMGNTLIPLDIAFFRADGTLINVNATPIYRDPRNPPADYATSDSAEPARFVLEMNLGWFRKKGLVDASGKVRPGTRAVLPPEALRGF